MGNIIFKCTNHEYMFIVWNSFLKNWEFYENKKCKSNFCLTSSKEWGFFGGYFKMISHLYINSKEIFNLKFKGRWYWCGISNKAFLTCIFFPFLVFRSFIYHFYILKIFLQACAPKSLLWKIIHLNWQYQKILMN